MKNEGGLIVALNSELTSYFKKHPDNLPVTVDVNALQIKCLPYLIEHIEDYSNKPFTDKFLWSVTFPGSKLPGFEYKFLITYQARYMGACGIVAVDAVYERMAAPYPWYLRN
ncbi:MAG: hypothetical protein JST19_01410 [Bacteroidetes bacterium]|nr:hypothetical protein [Bacteroidota bacterium]